MTEEQLHADVVAELFWGPEGRQRARLPHHRFASSPPTGILTIILDMDHQSCDT
jgi:hypothetical protein